MGFAFADALHLWRMQRVSFGATLLGRLGVDALGQRQFGCKGRAQIGIVFDVAANIAQHAAQLRS